MLNISEFQESNYIAFDLKRILCRVKVLWDFVLKS